MNKELEQKVELKLEVAETRDNNYTNVELPQLTNREHFDFLRNRINFLQTLETDPRRDVIYIYAGNRLKCDTNIQIDNLFEAITNENSPMCALADTILIDRNESPDELNPMSIYEANELISDAYGDSLPEGRAIEEVIEHSKLRIIHVVAVEKEKVIGTLTEINEVFEGTNSIIVLTPLDTETLTDIETTFAGRLDNTLFIPELVQVNGNILNEYESNMLLAAVENPSLDSFDIKSSVENKIVACYTADTVAKRLVIKDLVNTFGILSLLISPIKDQINAYRVYEGMIIFNSLMLKKFYDECFKQDIEAMLKKHSSPRPEYILKNIETRIRLQDVKGNNYPDLTNKQYSKHPSAVYNNAGSVRCIDLLKLPSRSFTGTLYNKSIKTDEIVNTVKTLVNNAIALGPKDIKILVLGEADAPNTSFQTNAGYYDYVIKHLEILRDSAKEAGQNIQLDAIDHRTKPDQFSTSNFAKEAFKDIIRNYDIVLVGANHLVDFDRFIISEDGTTNANGREQLSYSFLAKTISTELYTKEEIVIPVFTIDDITLFLPKA